MRYRVRQRFISILLFLSAAGFIVWLFQDTASMIRLVFQDPPTILHMPVAGVSPGELRNTWGAPRGEGRFHQGIDIFAPKHTPVLSTTPGIVRKIGQNRLGGKIVWILGPGGQLHYYAHLDRFAGIEANEKIESGVVIGYVGNTGNAKGTPPHLHYSIYSLFGRAVNPFPLLSGQTMLSKQVVPLRILPLMLLVLLLKPPRK